LLNVAEKIQAQGAELMEARIVFSKIGRGFFMRAYFTEKRLGKFRIWRQMGANFNLLDLDFSQKFLLRKSPKYLNMTKTLSLVSDQTAGAIMQINAYPYLEESCYLNLKNYDFSKHTAVFGASGMGKTKFLASLISEIAATVGDKYHFLVIDPHDAIRTEIGGLPDTKVYDCSDKNSSINLFLEGGRDIISGVDMTMSLIKTLISESWNARLERLTRASLYLLMEKGELSFRNLRRLLTDVSYKNACVTEVGDYLPESLQEFFLQEYNELKTQHYDATFARLVAFIDEMQLTPVFYRENDKSLFRELAENKVTLVSLSQARLGEKPVKVIAGLIMNQLFVLGMERKLMSNIILVVDEVAVVESPILTRFLSEARKYGISLMVAGQYYAQISEELRAAIYANVSNYFCFRLNYDDAEQLARYLNIDLVSSGGASTVSEADKTKMLATLSAREMLVRVERHGVPLPAVRGRSLDYVGKPDARVDFDKVAEDKTVVAQIRKAIQPAKSNVFDLMREQSTSRRKVN
jgi:DNA helicase HerA-like ATPase